MSFLWTIQQLGARLFHLRAEKNAFVFMVQKQKYGRYKLKLPHIQPRLGDVLTGN